MKQTSKKLVAFLAMFIILLETSSQSVIAKEWKIKTSDDVKKVWEVKFSKALDKSTVTTNNIYVTDGKTQHKTTLELTGDGSILQVSPNAPYEIGKPYMLKITKDVRSNDGKALTESVEFPFQIVNSDRHIQAVSSTSNGLTTTVTVKASSDVNRVTLGREEMTYKGKNIHMHTLINAKPGSTVSITAYDADNKKIDSEKFTIGTN